MWKTPGVWEEIPPRANIRAERKGTIILGVAVDLEPVGHAAGKKLIVEAPPFDVIKLDSRDQWEITYQVLGFDEVMRAAPVGTVWRERDDYYPRFVKVSDSHCTKQAFRSGDHSEPVVHPIILFGGPADQYVEVHKNILAEEAGA